MELTEPLTITRHVDLDIDADHLWDALTDSSLLATWLGDHVELDVRQGGTGTVIDDGVLRRVRVDHVHHGRELTFTWWEEETPEVASTVRFEVERLPEGTSRLAIVETFDANALGGTATQARASTGARDRWGVRVVCLWACTVAAAALVR
jgi:uncharacterized protein YndB with AHSA1/START domain